MELDRELTRRRMESVTSYDAFTDLALELGLVQETVFSILFSLTRMDACLTR